MTAARRDPAWDAGIRAMAGTAPMDLTVVGSDDAATLVRWLDAGLSVAPGLDTDRRPRLVPHPRDDGRVAADAAFHEVTRSGRGDLLRVFVDRGIVPCVARNILVRHAYDDALQARGHHHGGGGVADVDARMLGLVPLHADMGIQPMDGLIAAIRTGLTACLQAWVDRGARPDRNLLIDAFRRGPAMAAVAAAATAVDAWPDDQGFRSVLCTMEEEHDGVDVAIAPWIPERLLRTAWSRLAGDIVTLPGPFLKS